jgi:hypothetical protein
MQGIASRFNTALNGTCAVAVKVCRDFFHLRSLKVVTRQGINVWRINHFKKKKGSRVCDAAQADRRTKPEVHSPTERFKQIYSSRTAPKAVVLGGGMSRLKPAACLKKLED